MDPGTLEGLADDDGNKATRVPWRKGIERAIHGDPCSTPLESMKIPTGCLPIITLPPMTHPSRWTLRRYNGPDLCENRACSGGARRGCSVMDQLGHFHTASGVSGSSNLLRQSDLISSYHIFSIRLYPSQFAMATPLAACVLLSLVVSGFATLPEGTEECKAANLLQRSKTKGSTSQAGVQGHPFVQAVNQDCAAELSTFAPKENPSFYQKMSFLEARLSDLSSGCRKTALTGSAASPNPGIFEVVDTLPGMSLTNPDGSILVEFKGSIGFVKAPMLFSMPERSPLYKTWFLIIHCKVQPAPSGMLFVHTGGPSPGIASGVKTLGQFPEDQMNYLHEHFDIVVVDQRGMGLSSLGLLKDPETFDLPTSVGQIVQLTQVLGSKGSLVDEVADAKGVKHKFPCHDLAVDHADEWLNLKDTANLEEVESFLDAKAKFTALCSAQLDRDDGEGGSYNPLQYVGTQALAHDIEWMRWALGAPSIYLLGYSYGTRVAAAYASQFPARVQRVAVTGVMAPIPDIFDYAKGSAANTAMIMGFIQSQCNADPKCNANPWKEGEMNEEGFYFRGNINEAVDELFRRSAYGGKWYEDHCNVAGISTRQLATELQLYLTAGDQGWKAKYDQDAWPNNFLALPAQVFRLLQLPCLWARELAGKRGSAFQNSNYGPWVFNLIPALDMTGKWSKNQVAKFVTDFAQDVTLSPGLNMFELYTFAAYGWPQLPTPIGFSNPDIDAVIVQPLYDERTGMNFAQAFQLNFPKSSLVTSPVGGHCVERNHGSEAFEVLVNFLCYGLKPSSGDVVGSFVKMNFTKGFELMKR
eukprot:s90_g2.t1